MTEGTITFDLAEKISVTSYAIVDRNGGLVQMLTEEEARELAKHNPQIAKLMALGPQGGERDD